MRPLAGIEGRKKLGEARNQIALGHQHINRKLNAQTALQFLNALAHHLAVANSLLGTERQQVAHTEGNDDSIDRLARPETLEQTEKGVPGGLVNTGIAIVRRVPAGGINHHRVVSKPPITIPGATDSTKCRRRCPRLGQREPQARIDQCRCLARTRGTNEHVPRKLIEQSGPLLTTQFGPLQGFQRFAESTLEQFRLLLRQGLIFAARSQLIHHLAIAPTVQQESAQLDRHPNQNCKKYQHYAPPRWIEWVRITNHEQGANEPEQERNAQNHERANPQSTLSK